MLTGYVNKHLCDVFIQPDRFTTAREFNYRNISEYSVFVRDYFKKGINTLLVFWWVFVT